MKLGANVTDLGIIKIKIFNCKTNEMTQSEWLRGGRLLVTAGIFLIVAVCILQPAFQMVLAQERLDPDDSSKLRKRGDSSYISSMYEWRDAVAYRGGGVGVFKPPPPEIPKISVESSIA